MKKSEAKKKITEYILEKKRAGLTQVSIIELVHNLEIPATQVEKIMEDFIREGRITEVELS